MKRKGMQEELRMKNYELRWGKSPPRSKVLAQCAAVFFATPSAELKQGSGNEVWSRIKDFMIEKTLFLW